MGVHIPILKFPYTLHIKRKNNFTNSCLLLEITWDYPSKLVDVMEFQLSYFKF